MKPSNVLSSFVGKLSYPQISLQISKQFNLNMRFSFPNSRSKCSIVLVAGKALEKFSLVKETVASLAEEMLNIPYIMVLRVEDRNLVLNTSSQAMEPAMVKDKIMIFT